MPFRHLILLAVIALGPIATAAAVEAGLQTGRNGLPTHRLSGVVTDVSGTPLPGVSVELAAPAAGDSSHTTVTDRTGTYRIDRVLPGVYVLSIRLAGYAPVTRDIEIGGGDEDFRFDVQLRSLSDPAATTQKPSRRVVCGMTVITPPQNIDPKIAAPGPPPGATRGKPTIRAVQPTLCWEPSTDAATPRPPSPRR